MEQLQSLLMQVGKLTEKHAYIWGIELGSAKEDWFCA